MCSRFDQVEIMVKLQKQLPVKGAQVYPDRYNIGIGNPATIVLPGESGYKTDGAMFGVTKRFGTSTTVLYNARTEGDLNEADTPGYEGEMGIFQKKSFKPILEKRQLCLVPVNAFYEGPKGPGLKEPYRFSDADGRLMLLGAIYEDFFHPTKEETMRGVIILTTAALPGVAAIGHHRCPLLIQEDLVEDWLNPEMSDYNLSRIMLGGYLPDDLVTEPISADEMKLRVNTSPLRGRSGGGLFG